MNACSERCGWCGRCDDDERWNAVCDACRREYEAHDEDGDTRLCDDCTRGSDLADRLKADDELYAVHVADPRR